MSEKWKARGPDDFGDFTISAEGEKLAKCVVVQNGFRWLPAETKAIAERLIKAINNHDALVNELEEIRKVAFAGFVGEEDENSALSEINYRCAAALTRLKRSGFVGTPDQEG